MRAVLLMVRKDLLRKMRAPLGIGVMLSFPVAFSLLIALTFGGGQGVPRVHLLVENRDEGFLGNALMSAFDSNQVAKYFDVEVVGEEGIERLQRGDGSALLRVPETFTRDLIDGTPTSLELVRNPAQGIMPEIAEQVAGVLTEVLSAGSRALRGPMDTLAPFTRSEAPPITDATVASIAVAIKGSIDGAERFLSPVVIDFESVRLGTDAEGEGASSSGAFSVFVFVFPGVSVWALFMVGDVAMRDVVAEGDAGTLRRQLQGPVRAGTVILAKAAFTAVVSLVCLAILTVTGAVAHDGPVDPWAYLLLSSSLIVAVTGSGATVYGATGRQQLGATVGSVVYLTLGFAGGSFLQVDQLPAPVRALAPVSPFYWGTEGYRTLLQQGGGVVDVLPSVAVLGGLGVVLLATGAFLLGRRVATGGIA